MRHSFIQLIACSALYLLSAMSADADTYDAVTNQLTAPSVLFAGNTYAGVTVTVGTLFVLVEGLLLVFMTPMTLQPTN